MTDVRTIQERIDEVFPDKAGTIELRPREARAALLRILREAVAAEREACAILALNLREGVPDEGAWSCKLRSMMCDIAAAIRARP